MLDLVVYASSELLVKDDFYRAEKNKKNSVEQIDEVQNKKINEE